MNDLQSFSTISGWLAANVLAMSCPVSWVLEAGTHSSHRMTDDDGLLHADVIEDLLDGLRIGLHGDGRAGQWREAEALQVEIDDTVGLGELRLANDWLVIVVPSTEAVYEDDGLSLRSDLVFDCDEQLPRRNLHQIL